MTSKFLSGIGVALLLLVLAPFWQGCGLDPPTKETPPPPLPRWPTESPQDVLDNMKHAYNQMDYEWYYRIILDGFTFVFNEDDVENYPGEVPPSGIWGKADDIVSAEHMLDRNFVPSEHPEQAIDNLQLDLAISGELVESNLIGAPEGTLQGFVTVDLKVATVGNIDYLVNSRPEFYFAPGIFVVGDDTTHIWGIWQIRDAPYE